MKGELLLGNRIPRDFFIARGKGESDISIHAGSFHLALKSAGIEKANILTYSSILPAIATCVEKPKLIKHGSVMETIMSVSSGNKGDELSAGIIYGWLFHRNTGQKYGGLVCEHAGIQSAEKLEKVLSASMNEIFMNGFEKEFELKDVSIVAETFIPEKRYGTSLVCLCFVNYLYPIINQNE